MTTVWVDDRTGSKELVPALQRQGLDVQVTRLSEADFMFEGNGPGGRVTVGVERKTVSDLIDSIRSKRINDQIGRMAESYDYLWVLVEGVWGSDVQGRLTCKRGARGTVRLPGGFTEDGLAKAILSLELRTPAGEQGRLRVKQTFSTVQTASWLASQVRWFNDKPWDRHTSHLGTHDPTRFLAVSRFRRLVMCLPDIGFVASKAVEDEFGGRLGLALRAPVDRWARVAIQTPNGPRKLGASKAERIVQAIKEIH